MATFYGGEQLSQVVRVVGVNTDLDNGEHPVIYTIPTGFYGLMKFAYIGENNTNDYGRSQQVNANILLSISTVTNPSITSSSMSFASGSYSIEQHKVHYDPVSLGDLAGVVGYTNFYLDEGDQFFLSSGASSNQNVKYELTIFLYKKP